MRVIRRATKIKTEPVSAGSTKGKCRRTYVGDVLELSDINGNTTNRFTSPARLPVSRRV